jgi:Cu+-exporting ATPase
MHATAEFAESIVPAAPARAAVTCAHCGTPCPGGEGAATRSFCCSGCQTVYELLAESGLTRFYELSPEAGRRVEAAAAADHYRFLDTPSVRERLVDFSDANQTRVTFQVPAIHCVACIWLLENLFRLQPGIGTSQVHFARQRVSITFDPSQVSLSTVATLLDSLGYAPDLRLADLNGRGKSGVSRRLWLQLGIAGFAFGNNMLFSLPSYFGLDAFSGPSFLQLVGWLSLGLAIPVLTYSAGDYWRAAYQAARQRRLTMDVPIVVGIVTIFLQSAFEIITRTGEGYFDSLAGLVFFLLLGRAFQQKTHERMAFDRDYRSFFPLSVRRRTATGDERVALDQIGVGDRIQLRHGELVPADARVESGAAVIDYSFVTGEATPVEKGAGELVYAGGRQVGGAVELRIVKAVSQGYLTSLWNQDTFRKSKDDTFETLPNRYSQRFTWIILGFALLTAGFWSVVNPAIALKAFASILIVACPCALALAAPFTLGTAQRVLARRGIFLRDAGVVEALARVDTVVFDKTGTLTEAGSGELSFLGQPLSPAETARIQAVAAESTHPLARRIASGGTSSSTPVTDFEETPGCGVTGRIGAREVQLGSLNWLRESGVTTPDVAGDGGAQVGLALDGAWRGLFRCEAVVRRGIPELVDRLARRGRLALLSGDQPREAARFRALLGDDATLRFGQGPQEKLEFVRELQGQGARVMMVGDGLNDAGALRQGEVGVAVVEDIAAFSPASDVILEAAALPQLDAVQEFARRAVRVVRQGFLVSTLYNVAGLTIAASGRLSPIVCAILMPLSSLTVVGFACLLTEWQGRRSGLGPVPVLRNQPEGRP